MKKIYLLVISIFLTYSLFSQNVVTIDQCQQWAVAQTSANVQKELNEQILQTSLHNEHPISIPNFPSAVDSLTSRQMPR